VSHAPNTATTPLLTSHQSYGTTHMGGGRRCRTTNS
jgi:hypothetical protein